MPRLLPVAESSSRKEKRLRFLADPVSGQSILTTFALGVTLKISMISEDKKLRIAGTVISLVFILTSLILLLLSEPPRGAPINWKAQGAFMISICFVAAVPQFFSGSITRFLSLLFPRILFLFVLGASQGNSTHIEFLLMLSIVLDLVVLLPLPWNVGISLLSIFGFLMSRRTVNAWGVVFPAPPFIQLVSFGVYSVVFTGFLAYVKHTSLELRKKQELSETLGSTVERLIIANLEFQRYASVVEQQSMLSERKRISRDIHDSIGYTLTNIGMMMEAAIGLIEKGMMERLRELVTQAGTLARNGHEDTRRALRIIREIDLPAQIQGPAGILRMARDFENATKVQTKVSFRNLYWNFSPKQEDAIFRFLQEGLTNAFSHGRADMIQIDFWESESMWEIVVLDNGIGAPAAFTEGIGLQGMRERIGEFGGTIITNNTPDGFILKAIMRKTLGAGTPSVDAT